MRMMIALVLLAASAGYVLAGDDTGKVDQAALAPAVQQSAPQQAPADTSAIEQSFSGFSGDCGHRSVKQDTAKLLMN